MKDIKEVRIVQSIEDEIEYQDRATEIDPITKASEIREITKALKDTMRANEYISLAAPAIGFKRRIFCIDYKDLEIKTYINPMIREAKGITLSRESSIILPGKEYIRPRNNDITIVYQTPTGKIEQRQLIGMAAIVFQRELDLLDGLILSDVGIEVPENYDNYSDEQKEEFINDYLDSLDLLRQNIDKEIEDDPDLKEIKDGVEFLTAVAKGEVEFEKKEN